MRLFERGTETNKKGAQKRFSHYFLGIIAVLFFVVLMMPHRCVIPVADALPSDWNRRSFWAYPWGKSGTHKGIDIFAKRGTPVLASTAGLVVFTGQLDMGGNIALILSAGWRLHYYAHLDVLETQTLTWTNTGQRIGTVGATGNAVGKAPHLHYSMTTLVPYLWLWDRKAPQGWKKIFYLNPDKYL